MNLKIELMRLHYTLPLLFLASMPFLSNLNAQTDSSSSTRRILTDWDPVRGAWLDASLNAMDRGEAIPDRHFPEDLTPFELFRVVPLNVRNAYVTSVMNANERQKPTERSRPAHARVINDRASCSPVSARSYGDPHLNSFDGATYSCQTVGEFILAKSDQSNFEVQTRQQPQREDFSLNTAVAMNVSGDRVCIYANDKPDGDQTSALRVNGKTAVISNGAYFLPHGGTISYSKNMYEVHWPTGEVVQAEMRNGWNMNFINLTVLVYPCAQSDLTGLLGNANHNTNDDFDAGASNRVMASYSSFGNSAMQQASNEMEKEYLAFLAKDFARKYRLTSEISLFDYAPGLSTTTYTDERFPKVHRTVADLTPDQQQQARKTCEEQGIRGDDIKGCIYDQAYLQIPPSPKPDFKDKMKGVQLSKLDNPRPNVNPQHPNYDPLGKKIDAPTPKPNPQTISKPEPTNTTKPVELKPASIELPEEKPHKTAPLPSSKPTVPTAPSKPSTPASPSIPTKPTAPAKVGKG